MTSGGTGSTDQTNEPSPLFSVVKGSPTDEELAAVLVVLTRSSPTPSSSTAPNSSGWSAYWRSIRTPLAPGPGAWRLSGR